MTQLNHIRSLQDVDEDELENLQELDNYYRNKVVDEDEDDYVPKKYKSKSNSKGARSRTKGFQ